VVPVGVILVGANATPLRQDGRRCEWEGGGTRVSSEGGGGASECDSGGRECLPVASRWQTLRVGGGTCVLSEGGGGASGRDSSGHECPMSS